MSLNDWPIRIKLGAGFGTLIVICAAIGFFSIQTSSHFEKILMEMHDTCLVPVVELAEIHDLTLHHNRDLCMLLIEESQDHRDLLLKHMSAGLKELRKRLQIQRQSNLPTAELAQLGTFERAFDTYVESVEEALSAYRLGDSSVATRLIRGEVNSNFVEAEEKLLRLIELNTISAHEIVDNNHKLVSSFTKELLAIVLGALGIGLGLAYACTRAIVRPIRLAADLNNQLATQGAMQIRLAEAIAGGDLHQSIPSTEPIAIDDRIIHKDETGELLLSARHMSEGQKTLTHAMTKMVAKLLKTRNEEEERGWVKTGLYDSNELLRGDKSDRQLAVDLLQFMGSYLGTEVATAYLFDAQREELFLAETWGTPREFRPLSPIAIGDGIVGQVAKERQQRILKEMPADYLPISAALGKISPCTVVIQPLVCADELLGVIELGSLKPLEEKQLALLNQIAGNLALALKIARARTQIDELLEQAQQQSEELRVQQEELQQSNEELEERAQLLEQQREQISTQNREIEQATDELRRKADDLERISAYKSEFLANMSHELRSPLNSLLILSGLLQENREGHLSDKEIQFAATIHGAGKDLLTLINDILDLSKVEAGKLDLNYETINIRELCNTFHPLYAPQLAEKGVKFRTTIANDVPEELTTDLQRVQQILRNLLSNACKFTDEGEISLRVRLLSRGENGITQPGIAFEVHDTGIGVPPEKQKLIFEAFQQADGSTSRKYGGTGLGLSIAQQLAQRMGGSIQLTSTPGAGSIFLLALPLTPDGSGLLPSPVPRIVRHASQTESAPPSPLDPIPQPLPDDRSTLTPEGRAILIIEDDLRFARILIDMVHDRRFAVLFAADGESGISLADRFQPSAIILDVMLPHIDGWTVMRHLKDNPRTRHIPVHFVTCLDEERKALAMGAVGYIRKPVNAEQLGEVFGTIETAVEKTVKRLLVVEDNQREATAMVELLGERNVEIVVVPSGQEAIEQLKRDRFDCIVLDLGLADMTGFTLLEHIRANQEIRKIPVIIHSGQDLTREDELKLRRYAESIIIKGAQSPDRLLNEVTLFLHLVESRLPPDKQKMIRLVLDQEAMLTGKKVLIVDDDMRNIFSLSSILTEKGLEILEAENGREALERLNSTPDVDLILMDIMMPEMDGYETMRAIRNDHRFTRLPIIAMTAKALKGDQEKCLAAGASDYLSKPIDTIKLFSLLRVWLYPGDSRL